jgi:nucleotide-binding universal stress UspA family protein
MTHNQQRIVVGVDGSPASLGAVHWAADEAARHRATLEIVHVLSVPPPFSMVEDGQAMVLQAASEARSWQPGIAVVTATWHGDPATALCGHTLRAALVVVGSRGHDGFSGLLLGSVGAHLSTHAHCPVLVVHHAEQWAGPDAALPHERPIVVGVGGADAATPALEWAFAEADLRRVELLAVRAWQDPRHRYGHGPARVQQDEAAGLSARVAPWSAKFPDVPVTLRAVPGNTSEVLLDAARDSSMIVLGAPPRTGSDAPPFGSVTQQVLLHAPGAVLVARNG